MSSPIDNIESLMASADMDSFHEMLEQADRGVTVSTGIDPAIYAAAFSTDAGRLVLEDLIARFHNVTRWSPGEPVEHGLYREGSALVVFHIVDQIMNANKGE